MEYKYKALMILVGAPGCGKSTWAKIHKAAFNDLETPIEIVSSDAIRKELTGDEEEQGINQKVFQVAHERVKRLLLKGTSVIFDATNCVPKYRQQLLKIADECHASKECVVFMTPLEKCLENNAKRDRKVPEDVVRRYYDELYRFFPTLEEGYDSMQAVRIGISLSDDEIYRYFDEGR